MVTTERHRYVRRQRGLRNTVVTRKQAALLNWLDEHPWSTREEIAKGVGSTIRGVGGQLNRLLEESAVTLRRRPDFEPGVPTDWSRGHGEHEWSSR